MFHDAIEEGTWAGIVTGMYGSDLKAIPNEAAEILRRIPDFAPGSPKERGIIDGLVKTGLIKAKRESWWKRVPWLESYERTQRGNEFLADPKKNAREYIRKLMRDKMNKGQRDECLD